MRKKIPLFVTTLITLASLSPFFALSAPYELPPRTASETLTLLTSASPARAVSDLYNFALGIGAIAAFGLIVYSALQYTTTDSPGKRQEAQGRIFQSLLGLLLLIGATVVLRFINPDLPQLKDPNAERLEQITLDQSAPENNLLPAPPGGGGTQGPQCAPLEEGPGSALSIERALEPGMQGCFSEKLYKASGVAGVESGGNPSARSGTDKCQGESVSIGLFQINLSAHTLFDNNGRPMTAMIRGVNTPLECHKAFNRMFTRDPNACQITDRELFDACVRAASDPRINTWTACKIFKQGGDGRGPNTFGQWGPETKRKCGI